MASRRKLKKTLNFVSSELITDVYFRGLVGGKFDSPKVDKIVADIVELNNEFTLRANRSGGKNNPKIVKAYYTKLYADWQVAVEKVIEDILSI